MRVLTSNPIIYNDRLVRKDVRKELRKFSNFPGDEKPMYNPNQSAPKPVIMGGASAPTVTPPVSNTIVGQSLGTPIKTKQSIFDWKNSFADIANILNKPKKRVATPIQPAQEEKKGMTTTTKVIIGVSGVVVLGTLIYLITKK